MTRQKAFQTAAARRRNDPLVFVIDDVEIRLKASADLIEVADQIDELQQEIPEGESEIKAAGKKRELVIAIMETFILPDDLEKFATVKPDLDFTVLMDMLSELVQEYTGQSNPTQASSSSDGSPETGSSSTDGVAPEDSTSQA